MRWKLPNVGTTIAVETGPEPNEFELGTVQSVDPLQGNVRYLSENGWSGDADIACVRGALIGTLTPKAANTEWSDKIWED